MGLHQENFNTLADFVRTIGGRENTDPFRNKSSSTDSDSDGGWHGTATYEQAEKLAIYGWDEHLTDIKQSVRCSFNKFKGCNENLFKRTELRNNVAGSMPNIPRAIAGLPKDMIMIHKEPVSTRVINVIFDPQVNCGVETEEMLKAGTVALTLVNAIELSGRRVNLDFHSLFMGRQDDNRCRIIVNLKKASQPMNLLKLCFPLMNSGFERRLNFKWLETFGGVPTEFVDGYGHSVGYDEELDWLHKDKLINEEDVFLSTRMIIDEDYDIKKVIERANIGFLKGAK